MARTLAKILERKGYDVAHAPRTARRRSSVLARRAVPGRRDGPQHAGDGRHAAAAPPAGRAGAAAGERRLLSPPAIVLTGHGSTQAAVEAMKLGAWDYLVKPCNPDELLMTHRAGAARLGSRAREPPAARGDRALAGLRRDHRRRARRCRRSTGRSRRWRRTRTHRADHRRERHRQGAGRAQHPHARRRAPSGRSSRSTAARSPTRCSTASSSDIGAARSPAPSPTTRACSRPRTAARSSSTRSPTSRSACRSKFLRAIQEREVTPLGSTRAAQGRRPPDRRHQPRSRRRGAGRPLPLGPLLPAERRASSAAAAPRAARGHRAARRRTTSSATPASSTSRRRPSSRPRSPGSQTYDWPGNIRELQNVIERCFALAPSADITLASLRRSSADPPTSTEPVLDFGTSVPSLETTERLLMAAALRQAAGNKNQAARILGIDRQRLYRKLEKYGLE